MARRKTITREQVLNAAYALVANEGFGKFTARNIAQKMKCSTQPIYLEFTNMDDLREQVLNKIKKHLKEDVFAKKITGNPLHDLVLNYIAFAKNERVLYRAIYVEENIDAASLNQFNYDLFMEQMSQDDNFARLPIVVKENLFITTWIVATGIATLNSSGLYRPQQEHIIALIDEAESTARDHEGAMKIK